MDQSQIISLGSINVDFQARTERWPEPGETLLGSDFLMLGGGKGANVAYLARRLGVPARLIGHVGDDRLRDEALRPLRTVGIDLRYVKAIAGCPTGVAMIVVRPDGEKSIVLAANANDAWAPPDADDAAAAIVAAPSGSVLVTDLEVPVFIVRRAVETARQRGFLVVLDPSPAWRMPTDLYPSIDYLTPNPAEAEQLTGIAARSIEEAFRAGQALVERGVSTALVKLAGGGCVVVSADRRAHIPTFPVKVVDKTGAGDAFAGALAVALLERRSLVDAARFAVAAAAFAVTRYGSQPSYPTRAELERVLAQQPEAA